MGTREGCKHRWSAPHIELEYDNGKTREVFVRSCVHCTAEQVKRMGIWVKR